MPTPRPYNGIYKQMQDAKQRETAAVQTHAASVHPAAESARLCLILGFSTCWIFGLGTIFFPPAAILSIYLMAIDGPRKGLKYFILAMAGTLIIPAILMLIWTTILASLFSAVTILPPR